MDDEFFEVIYCWIIMKGLSVMYMYIVWFMESLYFYLDGIMFFGYVYDIDEGCYFFNDYCMFINMDNLDLDDCVVVMERFRCLQCGQVGLSYFVFDGNWNVMIFDEFELE